MEIVFNSLSKQELLWWVKNLWLNNGRSLRQKEPNLVTQADASTLATRLHVQFIWKWELHAPKGSCTLASPFGVTFSVGGLQCLRGVCNAFGVCGVCNGFPVLWMYSHGRGIRDKLWFLCEIAQCEKTLISIFQWFYASVKGILGLGWRVIMILWSLDYNSMKFWDFSDLS